MKITNQHPLGIGKFTDVVNGIDFFSPKFRWITGTDLTIDGGYSLRAMRFILIFLPIFG